MHGCWRLILLLTFVLASFRGMAEPLPWALLPLPGIVNLVDGEPSGGFQVQALQLLEQRMPDVQPSYRAVSRLRQLRDMSEGVDFCAAPFFTRADSDRVGYYIPFLLSTPIQAVLRRDQISRFPLEHGRVSLKRLLADEHLRGALATGRTYPLAIRSLLHEAWARERLESVGGRIGGENLLLMVAAGRIDYTLEFATVTRQMNLDPLAGQMLLSVPLLESRGLVESGIYCTRSPWGERMAARLDQAIRELAAEPEPLLELYRQWLPEETRQAYAEELAQAYRERSRTPVRLD